eukprot:Lithocolla_globosa_v1_NODE_2908_length_1828_cov_6.272420.p1 type:complete len:443 gc:universal NODE_2908_length_1828_cov_6.272420:1529-201(-)
MSKEHIKKYNKLKYVESERRILEAADHPFVVKMFHSFEDTSYFYFVLELAVGGDLSTLLKQVGCFDVPTACFYAAEIVLGLEHLHQKNIVHRDLKPQNILLTKARHIKITDFGSAKIFEEEEETQDEGENEGMRERAISFVGTAEYVSPEALLEQGVDNSADHWALACILYQFIAGVSPFKSKNNYQTFQKVKACKYTIPEGFAEEPADLVNKLLVLDPTNRLGSGANGHEALKKHSFFAHTDWENLPTETPPTIAAYAPGARGNASVRAKDRRSLTPNMLNLPPPDNSFVQRTVSSRQEKLNEQAKTEWAAFVNPDELILRHGFVLKRRGFSTKKRQLLLTDTPRLLYVSIKKMVIKGEIVWNDYLQAEYKNKKHFFVHILKRTFILEDPAGHAADWVSDIQAQHQNYLQRHAGEDPEAREIRRAAAAKAADEMDDDEDSD